MPFVRIDWAVPLGLAATKAMTAQSGTRTSTKNHFLVSEDDCSDEDFITDLLVEGGTV